MMWVRNLLTGCLLATALGWAESVNWAVAELRSYGVEATEAAVITDRLRNDLLVSGQVRVMERGEMALVMEEQSFQQTGMCDQSQCAVEMGRVLSVDRMVVGAVGKVGTLYNVSVRLLDVETGEVLRSVNVDHRGSIEDLVQFRVPEVAQKLVGAPAWNAEQTRSQLFVTTSVAGARIWVENIMRGKSPLLVDSLQSGAYRVKALRDSLFADTVVQISVHELKKLYLKMKRAQGGLRVNSEPNGAEVFADGLRLGVTPLQVDALPSGTYDLELRKDEFVPLTASVQVEAGALTEFKGTLEAGAMLTFQSNFLAQALIEHKTTGKRLALNLNNSPVWVPTGEWRITVEEEPFEHFAARFAVEKGRNGLVQVYLKPIKGTVNLTSVPAAEVWNGVGVVGKAPWLSPWLEPGPYAYTLRAPHYKDTTLQFELGKGQELDLHVRMQMTEDWKRSLDQEKAQKIRLGVRIGTLGAALATGVVGGVYHRYAYNYYARENENDDRLADQRLNTAILWDAASLLLLAGFGMTWYF